MTWSPQGFRADGVTPDEMSYNVIGDGMYLDDDGDWRGKGKGTGKQPVSVKLKSMRDDATAIGKYDLVVHDPLEEIPGTRKTESKTGAQVRHPYAAPGLSKRDGDQVEVNSTQSHTVGASVSFKGGPAKWIADVLGIDVDLQVSKTWEVGTTVVAPNVPANMKVYMVTFQDWEKITGKAEQWGFGGYAGETSYELWKPLTPGVSYEYPFTPSSDGSPHPLP